MMKKILGLLVLIISLNVQAQVRKLDGTSFVMVDDIGGIFKSPVKIPGKGDSLFAIKVINGDTSFAFRFVSPDSAKIAQTYQPIGSYLTSANIAGKVNYTDTAAMLDAYKVAINSKQPIGSYLVASDITGKLNTSDTSAMLAAYRTAINTKQAAGDYLVASDITGKLNTSDTSSMLAAYRTAINGKASTSSVTSKLNISDTATMLDAYKTAINGKQVAGSYLTAITSGNVTTALGFTPYNATNPSGYISSVPAQSFASITGKPTTLLGYGITDNILLANGSAAALTGFPTLNQNTTGTAANVTGVVAMANGGVPTGGMSGQVLAKASAANNDLTWVTTGGIGTVTQFNFTNSTGITGTVTNSNTTPTLGLSLTPTAIGKNYVKLAANFSSTVVTETTVTGWSFPVTAGKDYEIMIIASYQTAATTTGGELGFFLTTAAGTITGKAEGAIVNTAAATQLFQGITAIGAADLAGSNLITTGVTAINSPHYIGGKIFFSCTTSGTFNVGWATEVAASAAQLNAGSALVYEVLN